MRKDVLKLLKKHGATFIRRCKHGMIFLLNGTRIQVGGTISDRRAYRNIMAVINTAVSA